MGLIYHFNDNDEADEEYQLTDEELEKIMDYSAALAPVHRLYIEQIPFGARICVATSKGEAYKKLYPLKDKSEEEVNLQSMPLDTVIPVHGYLW